MKATNCMILLKWLILLSSLFLCASCGGSGGSGGSGGGDNVLVQRELENCSI